MRRIASISLLCLSACGDTSTPEPSAEQIRQRADALLFKNPRDGGAELERRLAASIQFKDGMLIVRDPSMGKWFTHIMPANSPWVIGCGVTGISVTLGNGISGSAGTVTNDVELNLVYTKIEDQDCAEIGVRLGRRLQSIAAGEK